MKVLVATSECQGNRGDDFFHGLYGELVRLPLEPYIDHLCNCRDSVIGPATSMGCTTFTAAERPELDHDTYTDLFRDALTAEGGLATSSTVLGPLIMQGVLRVGWR